MSFFGGVGTFLSSAFDVPGKIWDGVGDAWDDVTGKTQADAAKKAAATQAEAAIYAADKQAESEALQLAAQQEALAKQQALMNPYNQFGQGFMGDARQAVENTQQLFNDPTSIMSNPFFRALQQQNQTDIMQNAAVRGRAGTGSTQVALQDAALRTGFDVLNQERAAQMNNVGMLQSFVGMGQNAAANMGAGQLNTGAQMSNTMQNSIMNQNAYRTDAAAAQAAGVMGAANAQVAGTQNLIGLGSMAFGGLTGNPAAMSGGMSKIGSANYPQQPQVGGGGYLQTTSVTNPFQFNF